MFPIKDSRDNIIGFSGRILTAGKEAKYINIPETEIYHKRESLYGIHITKDEIRKAGTILVVEGEFDVIGPFQQGVKNVVAIKGSAVTKEHLKILKRYAQKIVLCLDADSAGQDAVMKTIREAEEMDIEIYVMELPEGKDPDQTIRENPVQFKDAMKHLSPAYDFILKAIRKKYSDDTAFEKKKAIDELVPFLNFIKNPILSAHYIKQACVLFGVSEESLREVIALYIRKQQSGNIRKNVPVEKEKKNPIHQDEAKQRYILSYLFQQENPFADITLVFGIIKPEDFSSPTLEKIAHHLLEYQKQHTTFSVQQFVTMLPPELHIAFDELYLNTNSSDTSIHDDLTRLALEIKLDVIKKEMKRLSSLNDSGEYDAAVQSLHQERSRLQKLLDVKTGKR